MFTCNYFLKWPASDIGIYGSLNVAYTCNILHVWTQFSNQPRTGKWADVIIKAPTLWSILKDRTNIFYTLRWKRKKKSELAKSNRVSAVLLLPWFSKCAATGNDSSCRWKLEGGKVPQQLSKVSLKCTAVTFSITNNSQGNISSVCYRSFGFISLCWIYFYM